jgi:hypothetical protein
MALKNLSSVVRSLGVKANPPCVPIPGKWNSCDSPSGGSPINIDTSSPCCGTLFPPINSYFGSASAPYCGPLVFSPTYTNNSSTCPVNLQITLIGDNYGSDPNLLFEIYINGDPTTIPFTGWTSFNIPVGGIFYFKLEGTSGIPNSVSFILQNITCGIDYGVVGELTIGRSFNCSIYPPWNPLPLSTDLNTITSPSYQYTGGLNPIPLTFNAIPVFTEFFTNIFVYIGPDPIYSNNPQFPVVLNGSPLPFIVYPINPGEYLTFEASTPPNGKCSFYDVEVYNDCPEGRECAQLFINSFELNNLQCP